MSISQKKLEVFGRSVLAQLKAHGASDGEVFAYSGTAREMVIREGEIEKAENATGHSVSVRAYVGKQSAAAGFSFDEDADLSSDLEDLVLAAQESPEDPYAGLADPQELGDAQEYDLELYDDHPLLEMDELRARALELEKAAGGDEITIDQSEAYHSLGQYYYGASNGFENYRHVSAAGQGVVAIHQGEELTREFASSSRVFLEDLESIEETGKRAYQRAWDARNPSRAPSGCFPVLFDERVASTLIGSLLGVMNASAIARRASWLIDYDEEIFPHDWQLVETPFRKRRAASGFYDGEGLLKKEQAIVQNGRPLFWINNLSSARQLEIEPSGHATRSRVNTGAGVRSLRLDAPRDSRDALLKEMNEGLLVTGFIGATINAHTGDYSRGARGFWIKNGEIQGAVNEITIASNLKDMLPHLRAADDDDDERAYVIPSLLVEEMTIAGA